MKKILKLIQLKSEATKIIKPQGKPENVPKPESNGTRGYAVPPPPPPPPPKTSKSISKKRK